MLRTDGFASVSAPWAGGELLTRPLIFLHAVLSGHLPDRVPFHPTIYIDHAGLKRTACRPVRS